MCIGVGNGSFFLSLLPPKKVLDAAEPVAAQLQFRPQAAEVVRLSEIMKERPYHPSMTLQKALTRLAPTCRKLWNQMDWIAEMIAQVSLNLHHFPGLQSLSSTLFLLWSQSLVLARSPMLLLLFLG